MRDGDFRTADAQAAVRKAVANVETLTSAEVVVAVRTTSGRYREADYLCGFAAALVTLLGLLYLPPIFPLWVFVPNAIVGFAVGAFLGSRSSALRRLLTPRAALRENVRRSARAWFVEGRYSRLPQRNAVLVYIGLLEQGVHVEADDGINVTALEPRWSEACRALDKALQPHADVARFVAALERLGQTLAREHPRLARDRNELPDEVELS
jgi:uncharacterized membrane protein